jgi:hypothetical protein
MAWLQHGRHVEHAIAGVKRLRCEGKHDAAYQLAATSLGGVTSASARAADVRRLDAVMHAAVDAKAYGVALDAGIRNVEGMAHALAGPFFGPATPGEDAPTDGQSQQARHIAAAVGVLRDHPAVSPVLGLHFATLARLHWWAYCEGDTPSSRGAASVARAAAQCFDMAVRLLGVSHGRDHELVVELDQMCREAAAAAAEQARRETQDG